MNFDFVSFISALFGLIGTIYGGWSYYSRSRSKLDLIKQLNDELADKTIKIRQLNDEILKLTHERFDYEMRYLNSRCDLLDCGDRDPKLPWKCPIGYHPHDNNDNNDD